MSRRHEFGRIVYEKREGMSISLEDLGRRVGVSRWEIFLIEEGVVVPSHGLAYQISRQLRLDWDKVEEVLMNDQMPDGWKVVRA